MLSCKDPSYGHRFEVRQLTKEQRMKGWGNLESENGVVYLPYYRQYFCDTCSGDLTPGPSGAGTNQVCEVCKINYGCLPWGLER